MPTRIVLKESTPSSRLESPPLSNEDEQALRHAAGVIGDAFATPPRPSQAGVARRASSSQRKVVGLRSSILRNFSHHVENDDIAPDEAAEKRRKELRLSNEDIRASPRLLGYLFGGIASTVMLVSAVQFYLGEERTFNQAQENQFNEAGFAESNRTKYRDTDEFFQTINGPVYVWKLWCCIAVASASVLMFFIILLMHFDTICFPRMWFQVFRDGSLAERNILLAMLAFWAVSLHINTSSFSVGEAQANVFFTSWIVFVCTLLNFGVWRQSANLPRLADKVMTHHRETMYNWCWTLLFNLITAGAGTDMYFNREEITFRLEGEVIELDNGSWMRILAMLWAEVALCMVAIVFNHFWSTACKMKFPGGCRFVLNWRFLEGVLIFVDMGFKFWIILTYTGVDGVITGLNNAYFGIWGSFFNIVFTFGTWLRENKDIDYII